MIEQPSQHIMAAEETAVPRLTGSWLKMARIAWVVLVLLMAGILLTSLPGYGRSLGGELGHVALQRQDNVTAVFAVLSAVASLVTALMCFGLAILFFRKRFTEPVAAGLSFYLLLYAVIMAGPLERWSTFWLDNMSLAERLQSGLITVPTIALLALFPNGRFVPKWSRWLLLMAFPLAVAFFLLPTNDPSIFTGSTADLITVLTICLIGLFAAGFYTQYVRYRYVSTAVERQQTKWVVYGMAIWLIYILLSSFPYYYLEGLPPDAPIPWWASISVLGWSLSLSIVPICLTVAITRYRLWDIDILINRTLVYGVLTAVTIGLYALVVGGMATLFQTQANWLVALIATGLVAVLFQPLRDRLQSRVNRLLYGHRDEPLEVLARLGRQLEESLPPEQVLPTLVETIAQTLKLPYAAISMQQGDTEQTAAAYGKPRRQAQTFPLVYQGSTIGHLHVAPRAPEETFTPAEARLLRNIARQAGTAVHALQLTADLQQARQQIVSSREEERRRLRRDLHDGLGPSLAATLLKIGSARALLANQPETSDKLLAEMESDIEMTLADVRRIVYDLRPPALDQFGLVGALRAYAETCESATLTVHLDAPDPLPPLPAAVEVAAYHIGREGLTNVVRHAGARRCTLKLWPENGRLQLTLQDDGQGFAGDTQTGVGVAAMRERADELGGSCTIVGELGQGVLVTAVLPIEKLTD